MCVRVRVCFVFRIDRTIWLTVRVSTVCFILSLDWGFTYAVAMSEWACRMSVV